MFNIKHTYKDAKRLKQIATALFKVGLGYYLEELKLNHHLFWHQRIQKQEKPRDLPQKVRMVMDELGGSFVKLGQLLSLRSDLIPEEYCEEFSKLQDGVTPFAYGAVKGTIEKESKHKLSQIFSYFDKEPVASASIGQVHKARLLNGERVVVKIQRPKIKEIMNQDIDLLYYLVDLLQKKFENIREHNLREIVDEFKRYTLDELDYLKEGRNIDKFFNNFKDSETVRVPKLYKDFTTQKVLTMSYIDGIPIDDKEGFEEWGCDDSVVAKNLANCFLKQVFEFGFFHADSHPANVFVLPENKIALLDYGICGHLTEEMKENLLDMLISLVHRDINNVVDCFLGMGVLEEKDEKLVSELGMIVEEHAESSMEEIDVVKLFNELTFVARKYKFKLPVDFILLVKAIVTCEGVGRSLDSKFKLSDSLHGYVDDLTARRLKPGHVIKAFVDDVNEFKSNMKLIPTQVNQILARLKGGGLGVQFERKDLVQLEREMERSTNRVSMGVIIAALIVASAIVLQAGKGNWLAFLGFLTAIFLTINIITSVIKERRVIV
ncbi:MAG: hypothetical protein CMH63_02115 [Nanoarchaeota archaeon]|nr:hypothetical protein [Nanoarchaeota archaeon]|tara:strand:- start:21966 stop:23612 length:1647 start_codon:yes stop_codon:yes gene_type:complete